MKHLPIVFLVIVLLAGCRHRPDPEVWSYMSNEPNPSIVVSRPDWNESKTIGNAPYYPVRVGEWDGRRYKQTEVYWCKMTDHGTCGNYEVKTADGSFVLSDYGFGNNGDPEAVYTSITIKRDGKEVMIPLEWNFELSLEGRE